ncbi:MAG: AI-2E family transporter, partial [Steroidobacteraceae bacterium]
GPTAPPRDEVAHPAGGAGSATAILVIVGVLVFVYFVRSILLPFVVGGIVAFVCAPLIDGIARRTRLPRWVPALIVLLVLIGLAAAVALLGLPPLMHEVAKIASDLKGTVEGFMRALIGNRTLDLMGASLNANTLTTYLLDAVQKWVMSDSRITELATYLIASVFGVILIWVLLGYTLFDGPQIARGMLWLVPPRQRPFAQRVLAELDPLLRRYFIGVALVVAYASTAAYIGLGIALGLQHAAFLAIITGVLEIIPLVGPAAAAIIVGLVAVQQAATTGAILAFIAYAVALRISIDQFFGPIVLGSAARVRPVVVMFCFLAGGLLFGIVGVILAVPVALTLKVILAVLYREPHTDTR